MAKKVALLVSSLSGGGAEGVCVSVANGLAGRGWMVDLVVLHLNDAVYLDRVAPNVNLINLDGKRARYSLFRFAKYIKKGQPDTLLVFKYELIDLAVLARKILKLNYDIVARNITVYSTHAKNGGWLKGAYVWLLGGAPIAQVDRVVNQSNAMEQDLLSAVPSLRERSFVIPNPVASHFETYAASRQKMKPALPAYLLCVGRLEDVKAINFAIEAFALIKHKYAGLRLKIVGKGSLESSLRKLCRSLNVEYDVDFEGFQTDLIPYYEGANVTLLTSFYEGFPNVLIESIVMGTPVVSFDCPTGPREILQDGKWGKLVPMGDVGGLATAVSQVLDGDVEYNLAERAKDFHLDRAVDRYLKVLE